MKELLNLMYKYFLCAVVYAQQRVLMLTAIRSVWLSGFGRTGRFPTISRFPFRMTIFSSFTHRMLAYPKAISNPSVTEAEARPDNVAMGRIYSAFYWGWLGYLTDYTQNNWYKTVFERRVSLRLIFSLFYKYQARIRRMN